MSLKCEECGLVSWVGETSCSRCGAEIKANMSGGIYSGSNSSTSRRQPPSKRLRVRPFFRALFYSIATEIAVLLISGKAMLSGFFCAGPPRLGGTFDLPLAAFGILFHLPSILIAAVTGLYLFFPLIQIVLMTCLLTVIFRWRESKGLN
jgi:hypothetical protein